MPTEQNANIAAVRKFYVALNSNDIPAILKLLDPHIERIEFEGTPSTGMYRGHAEMKEHVKKARATWAEGCCDPQRLITVGNKVVALVHVRVRLKESAKWAEGNVGDVFTFKDGNIVEMRSFMQTEDALAWAENTLTP